MIPFPHKKVLAVCAAAVMLCLTGCGGRNQASAAETLPREVIAQAAAAPTEQTVPSTTDPAELVEELAAVMTAGELYTLDSYPNLKTLDLSGSTCYGEILKYIDEHPDVTVTYTVALGGTEIANTETAVTLGPEAFDHAMLLENLRYLPALTSISLPDVDLNAEEVRALQETYPDITLDYTISLFGNSFGLDTTELDLSYMNSSDQVEEAVSKLGLLTNLTSVKLSSSLSKESVAKLQDSNPDAAFHYNFSLFGKSLSTTTETVEFKNQNIGNDGEEELRQALAILDSCSRFVLDNCKLDYDVLAGIREDFRDGPKVVWRVYFGKDGRYNALTDTELIRAVYNVTDDTCAPLRYCEDVKYMDIGHNDYLTDLSFVGYMPNLEVLIASGCSVKELVGFENCKKLTWLELAHCYKLTNIDSLVGCESLTYLNLCYTKVTSLMALDGLPLQRLMYLQPRASAQEQEIFMEIHPDCLAVFYGYSNEYGYGWRYDDNGKTYNEYYKNVVREVFNLDYLESLLPKDGK